MFPFSSENKVKEILSNRKVCLYFELMLVYEMGPYLYLINGPVQ